jgi:hypothetical protein
VHFAGYSRVVDHHIESAQAFSCVLYDCAHIVGVGDVNMLVSGSRSALAGQFLPVVVVDVGDDHVCAGIDESEHDPAAQA